MPVYPKPDILPAWTKPENASVLDPWYRAPLRTMVSLLGLDDPQQVMALGVPLETGAMTGGAVDALASRFPRVAQVIKAYHGSPHDFDAFDTAHIGTGEGAQAYGHGLYFAENPEVARQYRDALSSPFGGEVKLKSGGAADLANPSHDAGLRLAEDGSPEQAIRRVNVEVQQAKDLGDADRAAHLRAVQQHIWRGTAEPVVIQPPGRMYKVGIHASPDQFLDWDKPLAEQSAAIQQSQAVRDLKGAEWFGYSMKEWRALPDARRVELLQRVPDRVRAGSPGRNIYDAMAQDYGGAEGASRELAQSGIPGIKYLDGSSRAAGEGSRNYVVFDAATVEILKKYGIVLPAVGLGAAEATKGNQ